MTDQKRVRPVQYEELRQAVRQVRLQRHWTQRRLASELGASEDTVRSWERGSHFPSLAQRERLSQLGIELTAGSMRTEANPQEVTSPSDLYEALQKLPLHHPVDVNRRRMIGRVRSIWIDGVLKASIHHAALVSLGLQDQPDALANPWRLSVQETDLPPQPLPPGTSIVQVYDEAAGELLILGEPGAGKTTLLLELARNLLEIAENNENQPIPVVFNLSSWATKRLSLDEWLVEELHEKYRVPHQVAQEWIKSQDQLIILLDGLDEVAEAARPACIKAINTYAKCQVPLVVCCRMVEYYDIAIRAELQRAVVIQPLTREQIGEYLTFIGTPLEAMRKALNEDADLLELVQVPLMLSIFSLAYQGKHQVLLQAGTLEQRRRQVFEVYVQRMLARRGAKARFRSPQTTLTWLARHMREHNQTEFFLERLQPDWIPPQQRIRYQKSLFRLFYSILYMVIAAFYAWLRGGITAHPPPGMGAGLVGLLGGGPGNSALGWMAKGLGGGIEGGGAIGILLIAVFSLLTLVIGATSVPIPSLQSIRMGIQTGLRNGVVIGIIATAFCTTLFSLAGGIEHGLLFGSGAGILCGLLAFLISEMVGSLRPTDSGPLQHERSGVDRLIDGLVVGCCSGLSFALVEFSMHIVWLSALIYALIAGFFFGTVASLGKKTDLLGSSPGLVIKPAETVAWAWNGNVKECLRKGLVVALAVAIPVMVVVGGVSSWYYGFNYGLRYGLVYGVMNGIIVGMASILAIAFKSGWSSKLLEANQRFRLNGGIQRSFINGLIAAVIFGPVGGVLSGLISAFAFGVIGGLGHWLALGESMGITFSFLFASLFALLHGWQACIEHYFLRWYLWRYEKVPLNWKPFLDYADEHILLRKVGGGYMFPHNLLLDYFASLPRDT